MEEQCNGTRSEGQNAWLAYNLSAPCFAGASRHQNSTGSDSCPLHLAISVVPSFLMFASVLSQSCFPRHDGGSSWRKLCNDWTSQSHASEKGGRDIWSCLGFQGLA